MKKVLQLEELAMFGLSIYLLSLIDLQFGWWVYILLYLAPDIGMIGYILNSKTGALTYNLFHHKGITVIVALVGLFLHNNYLLLTGIILFGHSSMDRIFGFGLKYFTGFKHTHLGIMK